MLINKFKIHNIEIEVVESKKAMGLRAAEMIAERMLAKNDIVLGLSTGSTPLPVYAALIAFYTKKMISFKDVKTFNLDEYYPIEPSNKQSYQYAMKRDLFSQIDIPPENIHFPDCLISDSPVKASRNYEHLIAKSGGIDLLLGGIGQNAHIGFNEPPAQSDSRTRLIELTEETRKINSRFFATIEEVPQYAITMGLGTILDSKEIILCASGTAKSETIYKALWEKPNPNVPATYLQNHQNCRFILERAAAGRILD
ncbi:glucosamine-6-phosphate deaminase [Xenococcus sp. PCC 7305]|uniref:glucosamine-6-phosphate deaminase n=1 Tax=Xenococcus sp. PCC 7305 TaxID=102125 RepID=UPI0002F3B0C7|nr:glucosamine-6-phosphate deaminase [Xenococcus sp. PCC 7305]